MRYEVIWAIRDARGLSTSEKAFLFVVESRGTAKTYRKTLMNDTGVSDGQISNLVTSLTDKNCLVTGRQGRRTTYRVNEKGLLALVPERSPAEGEHSLSEDEHSLSESHNSLSEDYKKNRKKKDKKNVKNNSNTVASADAAALVSQPTLTREIGDSLNSKEKETPFIKDEGDGSEDSLSEPTIERRGETLGIQGTAEEIEEYRHKVKERLRLA